MGKTFDDWTMSLLDFGSLSYVQPFYYSPYAGVGFLQDLALVRQSALSSIGVVGSKRSSTSLLLEWMEYDRMVDAHEKKNRTGKVNVSIEELPICLLQR